jgi:hypothetical protein
MKTLCTWDNVACIVDSAIANPSESVAFGAVVIGLALIASLAFASYWKGF